MTASRWIPAVTLSAGTALGLLAGWILETSVPSRGAGVTGHSQEATPRPRAGALDGLDRDGPRLPTREPWEVRTTDRVSVDQVLEPGHRPMSGQVVRAEDGAPIAGARVALEEDVRGCRFPGMNEPRRLDLVTDAEGRFEARVMGSWDLRVTAPGRVTMAGSFPSWGCSLPIPSGLRFEMPRGRAVRGMVQDREGNPVASLEVEVSYLDDAIGVRPRGRSSNDGCFTLGYVVLGVPLVVIGDLPGGLVVRSLPIVVGDDAETPLVRVTVPSLVSVYGSVRRRGPGTVEDLVVEVHSREERYRPREAWTWTDARGGFELHGLEPGSYRVCVTEGIDPPILLQKIVKLPGIPSRQFWELELPAVAQATASSSTFVNEEPLEDSSESTSDDEDFPDLQILHGRVTGTYGEEVAATVALLVVSPEPDDLELEVFDCVETDPAGSIELEAPLDRGGWILAVAAGHASGRMALAAVKEGARLRLGPGRTLRGSILTSRGAAVPSLPIRVRPSFLADLHFWGWEEEFFPPILTAADGSFRLQHVTLEECIVEIGSPEVGWIVARRSVEAGVADVELEAVVLVD